MANPEHLAILKQGVEQWNKWRAEHQELRPDLGEADLSEADFQRAADLRWANLRRSDLSRAHLSRANLQRANLSGANLHKANLIGANLRAANLGAAYLVEVNLREADLRNADFFRANLHGAKLQKANISPADLSGANLSAADFSRASLGGADFSGADLTGARLNGAELEGAHLFGTTFADIDLSVAKNLEAVVHEGPSTVGIDTIYKSRGKIPEVFLRGCGVPDEFIAYIGSMVGRPIQFYSCFISYSTKDQEFAERLHADLQAKGVRCWFAPHDIKGGRKVHEQIDEAIRLHDRLLLILSEDSMKSEWVKTEIAKARKREVKDGKRVLFPVRLVGFEALRDWELIDSTGQDMAEEIRQYFIPDFSNWKDHDSYQLGFQRLVKDLKASG